MRNEPHWGSTHEYKGIRYRTHRDVYEPHEDTWLLTDWVQARDWAGQRVLEVGCGAGVAVLAAAKNGGTGVGCDRNPLAVRMLRENARMNAVHARVQGVVTDLVASLSPGAFDVFLFNPPYLPEDPDQRVPGPLQYALEGGPSGDAVIDRFLTGLEDWSARGARIPPIVLVLSNHNNADRVHRRLDALGLPRVERGEPRRYFFHRIWVELHR